MAHRTEELSADRRFTLSGSAARGLLAYARARGIPTKGVLETAGLSEESLRGPDSRISQAAHNHVWEQIVAASGDEDFGLHFARRLDLDAFHVVGLLASKSATVGEALERVVNYSRILHDAGRVEVELRGQEFHLFPGCRGLPHPWPRHVAEFTVGSVLVLLRHLTGKPCTPRQVHFRHPRPAHLQEHVALLEVEPRFSQPETLMAFDSALLSAPVLTPEPSVGSYLEVYARGVLARLPQEDGLLERVRGAIARGVARGTAQVPGMEEVAAQLALGPRTLQRRLKESGSTFAQLVDEVRQQYAERYLADDSLSVAEVGFLLGFSDTANFHRAFRRWTGRTPAAARAEAQQRRAATSN